MWASSKQRVLNITEQLPEYQSEMERNKLNLQTVLFRPLRSHQCSSEWFENWDMSTAQRAINNIYIYGWILQKVLAEIGQKDLILSQKALISNRRNLGLFAPTSMRFPSKDSKSKDLSF